AFLGAATRTLGQTPEPTLLSPSARLEALSIEVEDPDLTAADAERISRSANALRDDATTCVDDSEAQIRRLESNLLILGDNRPEPEAEQTEDE
ncbi:MAG: hypothetical protein AAGK23_14615, partial [Pseudomonadota bacterium]